MRNGNKIVQDYLKRTPQSREAFDRAGRSLAGANTRQSAFWQPYPLTIKRAEGTRLWDLDGNEYIDLVNNYTSLVHGHNYAPVVEAVAVQIQNGTCWSAGCEAQSALAEQIVSRVPSVDKVRFTNSGTEAGNLALTIARVVTGRDKILMARHGYHGSLLEFESGHTNRPWSLTYLGDFNDPGNFSSILKEHGNEIAAVFLEPMLGAGGVIPATKIFLESVMKAAHEVGALFVLDEVMTFRLATGGLQTELDIKPDLTMFGKFIGGGFPVGAVGGSEEIMKIFDPKGLKIFHGGTFNGNPISMIAGYISLRELTGDRIRHMERLAAVLDEGLRRAAESEGMALTINRVGSIMNLYLSDEPATPAQHRTASEDMAGFHIAALNHGLFFAPRGLIALSTIMNENLIHEVLEKARMAMADVTGIGR